MNGDEVDRALRRLRDPRHDALRASDRDHVEVETAGAAGVTDRGVRHRRNEDALAMARVDGGIAAVVCDGVSSSARAQDASKTDAETACRTALMRAAEAVVALARETGDVGETRPSGDAPACTYISAYAGAESIIVCWVGDSRAYWLTQGRSQQLTTDDSWAAEVVAHGALSEAEAHAHPNAHALIAWLGADVSEIKPHVTTFTPDEPGMLLVCSDGLWNYYPEAAGMAAAIPAADPMTAARHLVWLALRAGGHDNITVAMIPFAGAVRDRRPPPRRRRLRAEP